ncbi:hypothetical protein [Magnetofaba australis]|uniref:hypothetical protein n=1 Tax=Magnetofaba australis TaxID=1472297 RepID=UPI000A19CA4C|nr:hypothetical protein [Magnetofaba australis]
MICSKLLTLHANARLPIPFANPLEPVVLNGAMRPFGGNEQGQWSLDSTTLLGNSQHTLSLPSV